MKLGTETASLINHLHSRAVIGQPEPTVGMGATLLSWTDRNPATVIEVFKVGKTTYITVQDDTYQRTDSNGLSESQTYEYTRNPNGAKHTFRINSKGMWEGVYKNEETGRWIKSNGQGLRIGARERYCDPTF